MRNFDYDLKSIAPRNGDKAAAFEEFCCQVARYCHRPPVDASFERYRGAGGDGGVECVWRATDGDVYGWQAKYMFDLRSALIKAHESFLVAVSVHPRLREYTVCLPFDPTGQTARKTSGGRAATSQISVADAARQAWEAEAQGLGANLTVKFMWASGLLGDFVALDAEGGRARYWFDANVLGDTWFGEHLDDARHSAGPRYRAEISVLTDVDSSFEALGCTDEWRATIQSRARKAAEVCDRWDTAVASTEEAPWTTPFPAPLISDGRAAGDDLRRLASLLAGAVDSEASTRGMRRVLDLACDVAQRFRPLLTGLAAHLEEEHGRGAASSAQFRQYEAEYNVRFPAANLDVCKEVVSWVEDTVEWARSEAALVSGSASMLLTGPAGIGKTHAVCDAADRRAKRGLRSVVVFAERLSGASEPWGQIAQMLGLDASRGWRGLLAALDAAGEASGYPLIVFIDGLNETKPRTYWPSHLPALVSQAARFQWLRICMTCRTTYEDVVLPEAVSDVPRVTHPGFAGREFNATSIYFEHYGLQPPVSPVMHAEFSNPLYLRLVCQSLSASGVEALPGGWHGIATAIRGFLEAMNNAYARQFDCLPQHRVPEKALRALVAACAELTVSFISFEEARVIAEGVCPSHRQAGNLLDWLVREGALIVDMQPGDGGQLEAVRIAFERLGDHLLADSIVHAWGREEALSSFQPSGRLAFIAVPGCALGGHQGLLEALTIQLPERLGLELFECVSDGQVRLDFVKTTVRMLPWRDPTRLTQAVADGLRQALAIYGFFEEAISAALGVAVHESPVDAFWLHDLLRILPMPDRDACWTKFLHRSYEGRGPVRRLVDFAFEIDPASLTAGMRRRWAICLAWFCAAADRRVRDGATMALVQITAPEPGCWPDLLRAVVPVDDEYVVDRVLAAAYGVLAVTRDAVTEREVAEVVHDLVFAHSSRYQNAQIRDHARCILELAHHDGVLPTACLPTTYLPPYESEWPLRIPTGAEVDTMDQVGGDKPKLRYSCLHDDFQVYTLSSLSPYEHRVTTQEMGRWVFGEVIAMGYSAEQHGDYDGYMVYTYGGGRGRPEWAERIGKKYQRIALARLAARLHDHVKPKRDPWDRCHRAAGLTFPEGRDIDPTVVVRQSARAKRTSWWMPVEYDMLAARVVDDEAWTSDLADMPESTEILAVHADGDGARWLMLEAYLEWGGPSGEGRDRLPYRQIWMHISSYLVPQRRLSRCLEWLGMQQFFGRWMPEGGEHHEGFLAEYPWATAFNLYPSESHGRRAMRALPCRMTPTAADVAVKADSYHDCGLGIRVPSRRFFADGRLRWSGVGRYSSADNAPAFMDPSVLQPGPSCLLGSSAFLHDFVVRNRLALIWTVLGEKLVVTGGLGGHHSPAFSRAHALMPDCSLYSSTPVIGAGDIEQ